ncbi:MAG: PAS domain-containing protein [Dehalococcoidia bacterium]
MQTEITESLSRRIVEESPDAIIYADRDGLIRLWNAGAETMFGYEAGEAIGQSLDLIIPEKLRTRHWDGYHRVMATGETRYGAGDLLAVPGLHKDGSRMSLEFSIAILRDNANEIMGIAAILRDVTTRWNQERALHQRIKELEAQVST